MGIRAVAGPEKLRGTKILSNLYFEIWRFWVQRTQSHWTGVSPFFVRRGRGTGGMKLFEIKTPEFNLKLCNKSTVHFNNPRALVK